MIEKPMNKILISVIVPVYNAEKYLRQCLDSILSQTYGYIEVLCVDDGSTDTSLEILNEYKRNDDRIIVMNKKNEGVSAARNDALDAISGEYVVFVDADDWIDDQTIEIALSRNKETRADVIIWSYISEHSDKSIAKALWDDDKVFDLEYVRGDLRRRLVGPINDELSRPELADSLAPVWGKMYSRDVISDTKFIDLRKIGTYEDGLFNFELFGRASKVVFVNKPMYHYRRNNGQSETTLYRPELFNQWKYLFDVIRKKIDEYGLDEGFQHALDNRIALSILGLGLNIVSSKFSIIIKNDLIKEIINTERYRCAYKRLETRFFPIHWKVFYGCAKHRLSFLLLILLEIISYIIAR